MKKHVTAIVVVILLLVVAAVALTIWSKKPVEEMIKNRVLDAAGIQIGRRISTGDFGGNPSLSGAQDRAHALRILRVCCMTNTF